MPEHRTGARWVAATGAFLLAAAAAVFVGVRWNDLSDGVRFGIVLAFTAGCLVAGRRLRHLLPATADALFHLGAVLIPIDLAALNLRLQLGWRGLLVAEGIVVTGVLGGMGLVTGSSVLRRLGIAGGVGLACGMASVTPLPAPLVLALFAGFALFVRQEEPAVFWAGAAALAPAVSAVARDITYGRGTFAELGVNGDGRLLSIAAGVVAAAVLGRLAVRRQDLALATMTLLAVAIGAADGWFSVDHSDGAHVVAAASAFLLVQVVAIAARRDPFWRPPVDAAVRVVEVLAGVAMLWPLALLAIAPLLELDSAPHGYPSEAFALAVLSVGWIVSAIRRWPEVSSRPCLGAAVAGAASVGLLTGTAFAAAVGMAVASAALVVVADRLPTTRRTLAVAAAVLAVWGVVSASQSDVSRVFLGAAVAIALTVGAARLDSRILAVAGTGSLAIGVLSEWRISQGTGLVVVIAGAWALAVSADLLGSRPAANATRWTVLAVLTHVRFLEPHEMVAALVLAVVVFAVEAVRTDDERFAYAAAGVAQYAIVALALAAGLTGGEPGIVLCVGAIVWAGLAVIAESTKWQRPLVAASVLGAVLGLGAAMADGQSLATAAMVVGGLAIGSSLVLRSGRLAHLGGAMLTGGVMGHLGLAGVVATEAYLAPVVLQLVVAGVVVQRRDQISSWISLTPPVLVLGGAALAERVSGGPGWHAVVAGGVGVVAVGLGAWRRLAGPLVTGTALLVMVTSYESLGVAATVPTWAWLAAGGTALLATGVMLERNETSPMEAGRRLVDVVAERFE